MKISNNWLQDYVEHGLEPEALSDLLTMAGLEVDDLDMVGPRVDGIIVGSVLESGPHPNADRLSLCQVDIGEDDPVQIVCGAPNVAAGQKVAVATVGTTMMLPGRDDPSKLSKVKIKKAKIRGERSSGMICAEDEIGLSGDHSGIMVLDADAEVGQSMADYLEKQGASGQDALIDIAITPNRPDAISHLGVARDVAAITGQPLQLPEVALPENGGAAAEAIDVLIEDTENCRRYVAILVRGVEIKPSPKWMQARLESIGLRPRNNVVDITNYVMYELGQPLHAFDYDELRGAKIRVKSEATETTFTTLDSKERKLPVGTMMIYDGDGPVAIAGVMGGENSEVTDATTNVLIESAWFEPTSIRRTAKQLQLQTDASYRFERGVDTELQAIAAKRAADLMIELGGGTIVDGMVDHHPVKTPHRDVSVRTNRIARILGVAVSQADAGKYLNAFGFETVSEDDAALTVRVPSYRPDVEREIDLIEEVARMFGYDNLPQPGSTGVPFTVPSLDTDGQVKVRVLTTLSGQGFRETYTNSLLPHDLAERFRLPGRGEVVATANAISQDMSTLRPSCLPAMLRAVAHNLNHGQSDLRMMEFGHVFEHAPDSKGLIPGYGEREHFCLVMTGASTPKAWDVEERTSDLSDLKPQLNILEGLLGLSFDELGPVAESGGLFGDGLRLGSGGKDVGWIGPVGEDLLALFGIEQGVLALELDWTEVERQLSGVGAARYEAVSRFPRVERDIAVVVDKAVPTGGLLKTIRDSGGDLLLDARLFDIYEGEKVDAGKHSLAFGLVMGADRTLVDSEVDSTVEKILNAIGLEHGATLR